MSRGETEPINLQPTLRDQFAMAVIPSLILNVKNISVNITISKEKDIAKEAYAYADAMMLLRSTVIAMPSRYAKPKKVKKVKK